MRSLILLALCLLGSVGCTDRNTRWFGARLCEADPQCNLDELTVTLSFTWEYSDPILYTPDMDDHESIDAPLPEDMDLVSFDVECVFAGEYEWNVYEPIPYQNRLTHHIYMSYAKRERLEYCSVTIREQCTGRMCWMATTDEPAIAIGQMHAYWDDSDIQYDMPLDREMAVGLFWIFSID